MKVMQEETVHEAVSQDQIRNWQVELTRRSKDLAAPNEWLHDLIHNLYADMANTSDQVIFEIAEVYMRLQFDTSSATAYSEDIRSHMQALAILLDIVYMTRALC